MNQLNAIMHKAIITGFVQEEKELKEVTMGNEPQNKCIINRLKMVQKGFCSRSNLTKSATNIQLGWKKIYFF